VLAISQRITAEKEEDGGVSAGMDPISAGAGMPMRRQSDRVTNMRPPTLEVRAYSCEKIKKEF